MSKYDHPSYGLKVKPTGLVPCLTCEKAVVYYAPTTQTLSAASYMSIIPTYPSNFDGQAFGAIICDDCVDKAIQSKMLIIKNN